MPKPESDIGFGPYMPPDRNASGTGRDTDVFPSLSGLTLVSTPQTDGKGRTTSRVVAQWDVTTLPQSEVNNPTPFLVSWAINGSNYGPETTRQVDTVTIDNLPVEVVFAFRVRYKAVDGRVGPYLMGSVTTKADLTPPPKPSPPTATATFKGVSVAWNGKFANPDNTEAPRPSDFAKVVVELSESSAFTAIQFGGDLGQAGQTAVTPVFANTSATRIHIRLVAYDRSGNASTPSAAIFADVLQKVPPDIANFSITNEQLADLVISQEKIQFDAVGFNQLQQDSVRRRQIAAGQVDAARLAVAAIDPNSGNLTANSVTAVQIQAGSVAADEIFAGAVTTEKVFAGAIVAEKIASSAVTTPKLDALAVTSEKIRANAVIAGKLAAGAVTAGSLTVAAVTPNMIRNGAFEDQFDSWNTAFEGNAGGWYIIPAPPGGSGSFSARFDHGGGSYRAIGSTILPVVATQELYVSCKAFDTGGDARIYLRCNWLRADGSLVFGQDVVSNAFVGGGWQTYDGQLTVPNEGTRAQIVVYGGFTGGGSFTLDDVFAGRIVKSAQIQDGAIRTPKLFAESVTSLKVATNSLTSEQIGAGSITSDELFATAVTSKTVTGGIVRTAAEGQSRVELWDGDTDAVRFVGADNGITAEIRGSMPSVSANNGRGMFLNANVQIGSDGATIFQVGKRRARGGTEAREKIRSSSLNVTVNSTGGARISWPHINDIPNTVLVTLGAPSNNQPLMYWVQSIDNSGFSLIMRQHDGTRAVQGTTVPVHYYAEHFA